MTAVRTSVLVALAGAACSSPSTPPAGDGVAFPAGYAASYELVRDCRKSGDHSLDFVRVLASPAALGPYTDRVTAFPDGAVVVKEQYDVSDTTCAGPIVEWTAMQKHAAATDRLGWDWQRVSVSRTIVESNSTRCYGCHADCAGPPGTGYDYTCTDP
jgi:hypothetical protein